MLKPYMTWNEVSFEEGKWRKIYGGDYDYIMMDENNSEPQTILDRVSFDECFEFLEHNCIYGTVHYKSFFTKKPIIKISYWWDDIECYKKFEHISIRKVYREVTHMSLADIMKKIDAERVIQYLKERGLATCPMLDSQC